MTADAHAKCLADMWRDGFVEGLKSAKVMAGWFEGGSAEQVRVEIDVQIYAAEKHGIKDGMPITSTNESVVKT